MKDVPGEGDALYNIMWLESTFMPNLLHSAKPLPWGMSPVPLQQGQAKPLQQSLLQCWLPWMGLCWLTRFQSLTWDLWRSSWQAWAHSSVRKPPCDGRAGPQHATSAALGHYECSLPCSHLFPYPNSVLFSMAESRETLAQLIKFSSNRDCKHTVTRSSWEHREITLKMN